MQNHFASFLVLRLGPGLDETKKFSPVLHLNLCASSPIFGQDLAGALSSRSLSLSTHLFDSPSHRQSKKRSVGTKDIADGENKGSHIPVTHDQSVVFYKFRSARDFDQMVFDGLGVSVFDLKREIMLKKKLGKGTDFDLLVYNAQTNDEYPDDNQVIPRNTSILVARRPAAKHARGTAQRYVTAAGPPAVGTTLSTTNSTQAANSSFSAGFGVATSGLFTAASSSATGANATSSAGKSNADMTEEERMEAMFKAQETQNAQQLDEMASTRFGAASSFRGGARGGGGGFSARGGFGRGGGVEHGSSGNYHGVDGGGFANRPLPPGYLCYRCGKPGHHISQCPTHGDPNYDKQKLKRTTGIPKMFLKEIDEKDAGIGTANGPESGLMVTHAGKIVVATANDDAWAKLSSSVRAATAASEKVSSLRSTATVGGNADDDIYARLATAPRLRCPLCTRALNAAVSTACCGALYCAMCIRTHIVHGSDDVAGVPVPAHTCPGCGAALADDDVAPHAAARREIDDAMREFKALSAATASAAAIAAATTESSAIVAANGVDGKVSEMPQLPQSQQTTQPSNNGLRSRAYKIVEDSPAQGVNGTSSDHSGSAIPVISTPQQDFGGQSGAGGAWRGSNSRPNEGLAARWGSGNYGNYRNTYQAPPVQPQYRGYAQPYSGNFNAPQGYGHNNGVFTNQMGMYGNQLWMGHSNNQMGTMGATMGNYGYNNARIPTYGNGNLGNDNFGAKRKREDEEEKPPGAE
ncbi:hypothetical protein HDU82_008733 [Entophlyctis luteolus]|nr:hypothetical protein HDU82_008733 [Entophlyctis luteolus]